MTLFPNDIAVGDSRGQHINIGILGDVIQPITPPARNFTVSMLFKVDVCAACDGTVGLGAVSGACLRERAAVPRGTKA